MKQKLINSVGIYLGIFGLALLLYSNTFDHEYAYDDAIVITENDRVQLGIEGIPSLFKNIKGGETQYRYGYRPITLTSFALDSEWFLLEPGPSHIINTLWYALLCCLIFYFLQLLFPKSTLWTIVAITLIFMVHPLHTEVVANIKSRDEILMMFFGIAAAVFFLHYLKAAKNRWFWSILTIIAIVLSFLSRENGLVFGGILLLIAYLNYTKKKTLKDSFWIPVTSILVLIGIRFWSYSDLIFTDNTLALSIQGVFHEEGFLGNPITDLRSIIDILPNTLFILLKYLKLLLYPHPLVHDYGYGYSQLVGWNNAWVWASVVLHLAIIYYLFKTRKKWGMIQVGIVFYFLAIALFTHLLRVTPDYMAERYLFVPSLGFAIVVVALSNQGISRFKDHFTKPSVKIIRYGVLVVFLGVFIMSATLTRNRNMAWKNNATLFKADSKALTNNARFNYNYALELYQSSEVPRSSILKDSILSYYKKSISISKRSFKSMLDYGKTLNEFGHPDQGIAIFTEVITLSPKNISAHIFLTKSLFEQKRFQQLIAHSQKIQGDGLRHPDIIYLEGAALVQLNKPQEALKTLRTGLNTIPSEGVYFNLLSDLEYFLGDKNTAKTYLIKALSLDPSNPELQQKMRDRYAE